MKWIVFAIMILAYIGGNVYLYFRGLHSLPQGIYRYVFSILFFVLSLSFLPGMIFEDKFPIALTSFLQQTGGVWLISLLYILIILGVVDVLRIIDKFLPFLPDCFAHPRARFFVFCSICGLLAVILIYGALKYDNPSVRELEIATTKKTGKIPKIVLASDIHLGYVTGNGKLNDFVELINRQKPDMVILCGDTFDRSSRPVEAKNMLVRFKQIHAPLGIYAVLGNHEYYGNAEKSAAMFAEAGIILLRDSIVHPASNLTVVGRDDFSNKRRKSLSEIMRNVNRDDFIIVLDHQPFNLDEARQAGADLQFSGHTHDGQVFPINLIANAIYEKSYGSHQKGDTQYYITSGLGLWGARLRIGTRSEIVALSVKPK